MRVNILVKNNKLNDYELLFGYKFPYGVYPDGNNYYANNSSPEMTKNLMLQIIKTILNRKNAGYDKYKHITGISMNMMKKMRTEFEILPSDIIGKS